MSPAQILVAFKISAAMWIRLRCRECSAVVLEVEAIGGVRTSVKGRFERADMAQGRQDAIFDFVYFFSGNDGNEDEWE